LVANLIKSVVRMTHKLAKGRDEWSLEKWAIYFSIKNRS
jgi:hypothetical protein